ncbi:hypothetical protein IWQ62_003462 [Dispira parvispora]|uniref:FAD dependent oxidoreductase domain-containing protein n=1 Tax=Dispira parvispora TaxID=1520584 RepID=A0A9W8E716_9FUNG|nr:hypothetical protein IWQ62_003462 [Dispira parvispora]
MVNTPVNSSDSQSPTVVVLGAGVVGLTTALLLLQHGYKVTVVAQFLPGDSSVTHYTSPWAGANWRGWASEKDLDQQKAEMIGLIKLLRLADNHPESTVYRAPAFEFYQQESDNHKPWFYESVPKRRLLDSHELTLGCAGGVTYETVCLNAPKYLEWLKEQVKAHGGSFLRVEKPIAHINDLWHRFPKATVLVNCSGLQARDLGGVRDTKMHPVRGQTLLVQAPSVKRTITWQHGSASQVAYVIPRGDGTVIIGGTMEKYSEDTTVHPKTTDYILRMAVQLCPELVRDTSPPGTMDLNAQMEGVRRAVVRTNVGFRPARLGGTRVALEQVLTPHGTLGLVCHNYGQGSYGFQSSWGYAEKAVALIRRAHQSAELRKLSSRL